MMAKSDRKTAQRGIWWVLEKPAIFHCDRKFSYAIDYNSNTEPARVQANLPDIGETFQTNLFDIEGNLPDIYKY
jgi:hypothetical protein